MMWVILKRVAREDQRLWVNFGPWSEVMWEGTTKRVIQGCGGSVIERHGFHPAGGVVDDGENVSPALGGEKRANKVNMNVGETAIRNGNGGGPKMDMEVNFGVLA